MQKKMLHEKEDDKEIRLHMYEKCNTYTKYMLYNYVE